MPPKVENIASLIAKRDIPIVSLDDLYQIEPELIALEDVHKEIATKYRSVKIDSRETESDQMSENM